MAARVFCDTNILVYAEDLDQSEKRATAAQWLEELWRTGAGIVSIQVLQELFVTLTRKLPRPLSSDDAGRIVAEYLHWETVANDGRLLLGAIDIGRRHRLSFWDALVVQAAVQSNAEILLSEDLGHGQVIEGVRILDPFASG